VTQGRSIWGVLGIAATADARDIRRAYARQLKSTHPEDNAAGFQELRAAYEHAMHLAAQAAAATTVVAEPAEQPEPQPVPVPTPVPPPTPAMEVDEELRQASESFSALELALRSPTADQAAENRALDRILKSPTLQRLDILQRVELGLAALLADRVPRTDHLLRAAVVQFDWHKREHESSLPMAARPILARLGDFEFVSSLKKIDDQNSRAYRRLTTETKPWRRWLTAHLAADHPELKMLQYLSHQHPNLFAQIPTETVEWWREFSRRPGPSRVLLNLGFIAAFLNSISYLGSHSGENHWVLRTFGVFALAMGVTALLMLAKLYLIDWPTTLLYRRWQGPPPVRIALGWLPYAIAAVFGALLTQSLGWVPWIFAAAAAVAAWWSIYASGPMPRFRWSRDLLEMRSIRALLLNLLFFAYLVLLSDPPRPEYSSALLVTMCLALLASAFGRPLQAHFYAKLPPKIRLVILCATMLVVLGLGALVLLFGARDELQPWFTALALAITMLRRTLRHTILIGGNLYAAAGVLVAGFIGSLAITTFLQLDGPVGEYGQSPQPRMLFVVLLLIGAIAAIGRELYETLRARTSGATA
jgi:hypothetical protein